MEGWVASLTMRPYNLQKIWSCSHHLKSSRPNRYQPFTWPNGKGTNVGLARNIWCIVSEGELSWFIPYWSSLQSSQHIVKFDQGIATLSGANTLANTGRDNKSKNVVTNIDHTNKGNLCMVIPGPCMLKIDRGQSMLPSEPYVTIFCHTTLI
jgi:hypothetical protein